MRVGVVHLEYEYDDFNVQLDSTVQAQTRYVDCLTMEREENVAVALNKGVKRISEDCDAFIPICGDDLLHPLFIEHTLAALGDNDFVFTDVHWFGDENRVVRTKEWKEPFPFTYQNPWLLTALIRKSAWERIGGYDPKDSWFCPWGFWWNAYRLRMKGTVLHEPLFLYRRHAKSHSATTAGSEERERLAEDIIKRHS